MILDSDPSFVRCTPESGNDDDEEDGDAEDPAPLARYDLVRARRWNSSRWAEDRDQASDADDRDFEVMAGVWLYPEYIVLSANLKTAYDAAKSSFEQVFGPRLKMELELIDDITVAVCEKLEKLRFLEYFDRRRRGVDYSLLRHSPGSFVQLKDQFNEDFLGFPPDPESPKAVKASTDRKPDDRRHRRFWRSHMDEDVSELDGRSPREAAQDASLRSQLIEYMKMWINLEETRARDEGRSPVNLDWVLDELGLEELK